MTKYTNRTCHHCGARRSQPEMRRETTYVESGRSRPGVSARTGVGFLLGEKKSANSVVRWMFNTNQRIYQRKREVWVCKHGCNTTSGSSYDIGHAIGTAIAYIVIFVILVGVSMGLSSGPP